MSASQRGPATLLDRAPAVLLRLGHPGLRVLAGFARQGPAVATLSIFVEPMTERVRLVAHGAVGRGLAGRRAGGAGRRR